MTKEGCRHILDHGEIRNVKPARCTNHEESHSCWTARLCHLVSAVVQNCCLSHHWLLWQNLLELWNDEDRGSYHCFLVAGFHHRSIALSPGLAGTCNKQSTYRQRHCAVQRPLLWCMHCYGLIAIQGKDCWRNWQQRQIALAVTNETSRLFWLT